MSTSNNPFTYYTAVISRLLARAKKQENPALWLYTNKLRTSLFMMEGLCRLFGKGLHRKGFKSWLREFKKLEDALGQVDFYDAFVKEFSENRSIPPDVIYYFQAKRERALEKFDKALRKGNYLEEGLGAFRKDLRELNVKFDAGTISDLEKAIAREFEALRRFAAHDNYHYTQLEDEVHELRRKLRWPAIYAEALRGIVVLKQENKSYSWEKRYITPKVLASPYNRIPVNRAFPAHIRYKRKHYIATNWLIAELGTLKDHGMNIGLLAKALHKTQRLSKEESEKKAMKMIGTRQSINSIIKKASLLSKEFFQRHNIAGSILEH